MCCSRFKLSLPDRNRHVPDRYVPFPISRNIGSVFPSVFPVSVSVPGKKSRNRNGLGVFPTVFNPTCRCAVSHFHFHIVVEELQETGRWESDGNDHSVPGNRTTGRWQASMIAVGRRNHGKVEPSRFQTSGGDITPAVDSPTRRSPAASSSLRLRYFSAGRRDAKVGRVAEPALMLPSWALVLFGVV